eukprot:gene13295-15362_t
MTAQRILTVLPFRMLQESDLDSTMGSRPKLDARARLEQAKHRYENLLLNVGPTMIADELTASQNSVMHSIPTNSAPLAASLDRSAASSLLFEVSPDVNRSFDRSGNGFDFQHYRDTTPIQRRRPGFSQDYVAYEHTRDGSGGRGADDRPEETIILLQEENDRLRAQLDHLTTSTEQLLQEAEDTSTALIEKYEGKIDILSHHNERLAETNAQLEESLQATRDELAQERAQLQKA